MEIVKRIVLTILAVIFGICFTWSFSLGFMYHDLHLGIRFACIGFIILCLFIGLWFCEDIRHWYKNRK